MKKQSNTSIADIAGEISVNDKTRIHSQHVLEAICYNLYRVLRILMSKIVNKSKRMDIYGRKTIKKHKNEWRIVVKV